MDGIIYNEIIMLGKYNHYFFRYEICQCEHFDLFISYSTIFEYRNGLYTPLHIKELSLDWLNDFIE